MQTPLILTIQADEVSQTFFNEKRQLYFPPEKNFIDAHLTLFHHLPDYEPKINIALEELCSRQTAIHLPVTELKNIGKGVVYKIESKELIALHKKLQKHWGEYLTMQDRQGLWPHITIQNKVTAYDAQRTLQEIKETFLPFEIQATGLTLWRYLNGSWQQYRHFLFAG